MANRNATRRLAADRNIAKGAAPRFRRQLVRERDAVLAAAATADTPAEFRTAAGNAVSTAGWTTTVTGLWLSDPVLALWDEVQATLGTEYPVDTTVRRRLGRYAADHAVSIAETRRNRLDTIADPKARYPKYRSTMRRRVRELYADVTTLAERMAFTETLSATETVRYESMNLSATRSKLRIRKVWFTVGDSNVRPTHQAVNGRSRFVDHRGRGGREGTFTVGGATLRYPRDPNGPPDEVVNCRCFLEYRRVRQR